MPKLYSNAKTLHSVNTLRNRPNQNTRLRMKRILSLLLLVATLPGTSPGQPVLKTVHVLMLSDIHLDPFHDPAKFSQLLSAPVAAWTAILASPPSPTLSADFAKLQSTCGARGIDTPDALLESSLRAAHTQQPKPLFVTVSGDLLAHQFDCRFHTLAPTATPADFSAFAAKTVAFVALRLRETFPATPIYLALGNNDSGCADYQEDPNSAFLQADATTLAAGAATPADAAAIQHDVSQFGDYNVALPIPHARLIVLQDIFQSKKYKACDGNAPLGNMTPAEIQIAWLRMQLEHARAAHQMVWLMAHIPPGVDAYSTLSKGANLCSTADKPAKPTLFLSSDALADTISDFYGVISLALFGHTHMDEFRSFSKDITGRDGDLVIKSVGFVPGKLVPSISPVNGNNPAFTVADLELDPTNTYTSTMIKDYAVFVADNQTGINTSWSQEYRYSTTYHQPDLSGLSIIKIRNVLAADKAGLTDDSQAYIRYAFATGITTSADSLNITARFRAAAMQAVWPAYACVLTNHHAADFLHCACPAKSAPASTR